MPSFRDLLLAAPGTLRATARATRHITQRITRRITRRATPLAGCAVLGTAVATMAASRPAAAQSSAVQATLSLVGMPQPCLSTGMLAGAHDVGTSCLTSSVRPRPADCPPNTTCYIYQDPMVLDSVWGRVRASNTAGQLRVNSDLVVQTQLRPGTTPGSDGGYSANAYAAWSDKLDLGTTPRSDDMWVAFDLYAHGFQSVSSASGGNNAVSWNTFQRYTFNFDMSTEWWNHDSSDWYGQSSLMTTGPAPSQRMKSGTLQDSRTVWRKVGKNERFLSFAYNFRSEATVPSGVAAGDPTNYYVYSRVRGDFGSTAGLTGVRFYDATKSQQLTDVNYAFVNGTQFVTTTPEPGTWALLGTGLLAIGGVARRRRGHARG